MRGHNRMSLLTQKVPSQPKDKTIPHIYEDLRDLEVCFTLCTKSPTQMLKGERVVSELKTQKLLWLEKKPNKTISRWLTHLPPQQPLEEDLPLNGKVQPTTEFNYSTLKVLPPHHHPYASYWVLLWGRNRTGGKISFDFYKSPGRMARQGFIFSLYHRN